MKFRLFKLSDFHTKRSCQIFRQFIIGNKTPQGKFFFQKVVDLLGIVSYNILVRLIKVLSRKEVVTVKMKINFNIILFRNLSYREGWLDKADVETKNIIEGKLFHVAFAENQGESLEKVCLLICKYTSRNIEPLDVANFITWNCSVVNVD